VALAADDGAVSAPLLLLDAESPFPPYEQICMQLRAQIAGGRLRPGDQLPSVRQLARDLRLAPNTIARAYGELEREGWVAASPRRGVTVAPTLPMSLPEARRRELADLVTRLLAAARPLGVSAAELHAEIDRQLSASERPAAP